MRDFIGLAILAVVLATCIVSCKECDLKIGSYNIRYQTSRDTADRNWSVRKQYVSDLIKEQDFDVCGLVEVREGQQNDLKELLGSSYAFHLCGRSDGCAEGEAVGLIFKTSKLSMVTSGRFFLSPTPDVPGEAVSWADPAETYNRNRLVTWARLKDKASGKEFYVFVAHFELNPGTRLHSSELVLSKIKEIDSDNLPAFFCGDLNANPDEACIMKLSSVLNDSYQYALDNGKPCYGQAATFNSFDPDCDKAAPDRRIDYMYFTEGVKFNGYGVLYTTYDGILPSDHFPIYVEVTI